MKKQQIITITEKIPLIELDPDMTQMLESAEKRFLKNLLKY